MQCSMAWESTALLPKILPSGKREERKKMTKNHSRDRIERKKARKKPVNISFTGSNGGDGGIRTPGRFDPSTDFESASLRPLRYISVSIIQHQKLGNWGELMGRIGKNIKLRKPEKPCKIKGFRTGGYRIATTISSHNRHKTAAHFLSSATFLTYRPLLILASAGLGASSGIAHE